MRALMLIALTAGALLAGPANAADPLKGAIDMGGVNLNNYCVHYYGSNYHSAVLNPGTAYDWKCVAKIHHAGTVDYGISVNNACLLQYGLPGLFAVPVNPANPTSWRCFRHGGPGIHQH